MKFEASFTLGQNLLMSSLKLHSETGSKESRKAPKDKGLEHQKNGHRHQFYVPMGTVNSLNQGIEAAKVI
jgi:hypothetical protein